MEEAVLKEHYWQFLQHPEGMETDLAQQLLKRYPYCHSLWLSEAKRMSAAVPEAETSAIYNKAALFCRTPEQLYAYIHPLPIATNNVEESSTIPTDPIAKLDHLLDKGLAKAEPTFITPIIEEPIEHVPVKEKTTVSKYDDELMPYTFVWWLHKTRMAFADTYQPYAPKARPAWKQAKKNVDHLILDQQIRENIFHLQPPEQKLSVDASREKNTYKINHKTDELIERFIREEPQIKPPQANKITLENKARQSAEDQSAFVTETLALIYVEQGLYHKAIDTYQKLSLKYPEKSAYFADRIKALESKI